MNKSSSCPKKTLIVGSGLTWAICKKPIVEGATFCTDHQYAEDTLRIGAALHYPLLHVNEHSCMEDERGWYEDVVKLFEPHERINNAVPRVTQVYRAIVAYCDDHLHSPSVDRLLEAYFYKYVQVQPKPRHLHLVKP